jgi:hypothetical protein
MLVLGLVVTACGSTSTPKPGSASGPAPTAVDAATPTPTGAPTPDTPATDTPEPGATSTPRPARTPTPTNPPSIITPDGNVVITPIVATDPDWESDPAITRFARGVWETDFQYHTIDFNEVFSGGVGRDGGIRPIDRPIPTDIASADEWISR